LEPLLNLVSNQEKKAVLIPEKDQISLEHETPHFDEELVIYINIEKT